MKKISFFLILLSFLTFSTVLCSDELPAFDWNPVLQAPPNVKKSGNQVLHFNASNKPCCKDQPSKQFVQQYLKDAKVLHSDAEALKFASEAVRIKGAFIELGVCTGKTINFIAALNPTQKIYGFDSFEGLPEDWIRQDKVIKKGTFGFKDLHRVPPVLNNVVLIKGWFKDSLPPFVRTHLKHQPIALLHVDSDIYSAAKTGFSAFATNIVPDTIIIFDEFYNYPGFEHHEFQAFMEFMKEHSLKAEFLAYNVNHEQVVIRITRS